MSISLKTLLLTSLALSSSALAATSGTVTLGGVVDSTLAVTSSDTTEATALALNSSGVKIVNVSAITLTTNKDLGLTFTATPHPLTKAGGQDITVQVTTVASGTAAPAAGDFSAGAYQIITSAATSLSKDLYIKYSPGTTQDPGEYEGSIDLVVADNT